MASWSLATSRERIARELNSLFYEFYLFGVAFRSHYNAAIAREMEKLDKIQESDDFKRTAVGPAVDSAARCYHYVHWWPILRQALRKRFRVQAVIALLVLLVSVIFVAALLSVKPSPVHLNAYGAWFSIIVFIGFLFIGYRIYSRVLYTYKALALFFITGLIFDILGLSHAFWRHAEPTWRRIISPFSSLRHEYAIHAAPMPIAHLLQWVLWFIALIFGIASYRRFISFCGKAVARKLMNGDKFGYGMAAEQSASVIINLLDIRHSLSEIPSDNQRYCDANVARNVFNANLINLAFLIKGPWHETMRSRYGSAGEWIAGHAPRIELFIRHQQVKNVLLSNNLLELRDAMTSTLVHAANGNWHLIATGEEYANTVITRRRSIIMRRVIAIAISIGFAIAALHYMRHSPALLSSIAGTCIIFALVQLAGLLDPDAPTALDVAGRVANTLKRGG